VSGRLPDFALLDLVVFYIKKFPEAQHHPKEDLYLFDCLRKRTHELDEVFAVLQQQHTDRSLLDELTQTLAAYKSGQTGARSRFALALDAFSKAEFQHMALEEHTVLPAARKHLEKEDWARMATAFGENKTPGPDNVTDGLFKGIFSRLMRNASPADRLVPTLAE
jgi:hemerythrin-like domain-containing protein